MRNLLSLLYHASVVAQLPCGSVHWLSIRVNWAKLAAFIDCCCTLINGKLRNQIWLTDRYCVIAESHLYLQQVINLLFPLGVSYVFSIQLQSLHCLNQVSTTLEDSFLVKVVNNRTTLAANTNRSNDYSVRLCFALLHCSEQGKKLLTSCRT